MQKVLASDSQPVKWAITPSDSLLTPNWHYSFFRGNYSRKQQAHSQEYAAALLPDDIDYHSRALYKPGSTQYIGSKRLYFY